MDAVGIARLLSIKQAEVEGGALGEIQSVARLRVVDCGRYHMRPGMSARVR